MPDVTIVERHSGLLARHEMHADISPARAGDLLRAEEDVFRLTGIPYRRNEQTTVGVRRVELRSTGAPISVTVETRWDGKP